MTAEQARRERIAEAKTLINLRVQARYDYLRAEGKRGHYETMFQIIHEERANAAADALERVQALEKALHEVKKTLTVQHALEPNYGWGKFVAETIDPFLEAP